MNVSALICVIFAKFLLNLQIELMYTRKNDVKEKIYDIYFRRRGNDRLRGLWRR